MSSASRACAAAGLVTLAALGIGWDASSPADAAPNDAAPDGGDAATEDATLRPDDGERYVHPLYGMPRRQSGCW
jgi:hypothetical protein